MDEIKYKLRSENAILVTEAIDILIQRIIDSSKDVLLAGNAPMLFDKFKEKCLSESKLVSLTACYGFQKLINCGYLSKTEAMSLVMTMLPNVKNLSCVIPIITEILISSGSDASVRWSLVPPQHPFIIIIQHHADSAQDILLETQAICHNKRTSQQSLKIMRPVFIWLICYPEKSNLHIAQEMIKLLLQLNEDPLQFTVLCECITLQKFVSKSSCLFASKIIFEVANWAIDKNHKDMILATMLLLANACYYLILNEHDPRSYFILLSKMMENPHSCIPSETILGILSSAILICPITYIADLFSLCKIIHRTCEDSISSLIFASALIHWLHHPTYIAEEILTNMKITFLELMKTNVKPSKNATKLFEIEIIKAVKLSNSKIHTMLEILNIHSKITESQNNSNNWLNHCENTTNKYIQTEMNLFLQAIILQMTNYEHLNKTKVFEILLKSANGNKKLAFGLLPITIYAIKVTKEPLEMLTYIRGIPQLAFAKENVHSIVNFYEELVSKKMLPLSLLIDVHTLLVDSQMRCYPYLQSLLDDSKLSNYNGSKNEYLIAKASAVKHICKTRAANYGAELVPMISSILNRCTDSDTSAAFCLALEALKSLWLAHIVSPPSTWKVLSPKLKKDQRPSVQKAVCDLLSVVPQLTIEESEYDVFIDDVISTFWHFAMDFHNAEVANAAFVTLSTFKIQDIKLKQMPSVFRTNIKLPSEHCKTPEDAARSPEEVLDYIPSECWGNCFKYVNHETLSGISEMCYQLMFKEIKEYRSGVYQTKQQLEPNSADYLPPASVVRGVMEFLRKQVTNKSYDVFDSVLLECITCLSRKFLKPLPPLNWYFLHDIFHGGKNFKQPCLMLATRQAIISVSALNFINNYLKSVTVNEETVEEILYILPELCEVIPAVDINPVFTNLFSFVFENNFITTSKAKPENFTNVIKKCLSNEKTHEDCIKMISSAVVEFWNKIEETHQGWKYFVEICCELSSESLQTLTSPTSWWEVTEDNLKKSCCVRSKIAILEESDQSIIWMNEVIDAALKLNGSHTYILESIVSIFSKRKFENIPTSKSWLLQLMAKTHIHMTEATCTETSAIFLCDIIIIALIFMSQNHVFMWKDLSFIVTSKSVRLNLFPQATNVVLSNSNSNYWKDAEGQILEWLHHSKNNKILPKEYSDAFYLSILSARNCTYFSDVRVCNKFYNSIHSFTM